jgi:acyl-lipid omega-6 desaturase (Delta-12 desaturase)
VTSLDHHRNSPTPAHIWSSRLLAYKQSNNYRGLWEILLTAVPFAGLWAGASIISHTSIYLALIFAIPAAGFMLRLFMIQHDCGHGSLFSWRAANDWVGRVIGVVTLTPYDYWRQSHASHHAGSGNLDRRGIGDIDILTVREYLALGWRRRLRYRLYRHPLVMFGLGPAYLFILRHRLPIGAMTTGSMPWISTQLTNLGLLAASALLVYAVGLLAFLMIQATIVIIAASAGVWLFYVQHQFERTYWEHQSDWTHSESSLHGSSFYDLPQPLMWFTANIGVHHLHHLSSRIPFYRLQQILRDYPELRTIGRLTIWQSLKCVRLALWDEDKKQLVSFASSRQLSAA